MTWFFIIILIWLLIGVLSAWFANRVEHIDMKEVTIEELFYMAVCVIFFPIIFIVLWDDIKDKKLKDLFDKK